jgi:hypothetical protein
VGAKPPKWSPWILQVRLQIGCIRHILCLTCIQSCHCKSLWEELSWWGGGIKMKCSDLNLLDGSWFAASLFMAMKFLVHNSWRWRVYFILY